MSRRAKNTIWIFVLIILALGWFLVWNKYTGWFKIGADVVATCEPGPAELNGIITDQNTGNPIQDAAAWADGNPAPLNKTNYLWNLDKSTHKILLKAPGYEDTSFTVDLTCLAYSTLDMSMKPLPNLSAGSISGAVSLASGDPLLVPATIFLDDKAVGSTNFAGLYEIPGVRAGVHKVTAQINVFPSVSRETSQMAPGQNLKNFDITIGSP